MLTRCLEFFSLAGMPPESSSSPRCKCFLLTFCLVCEILEVVTLLCPVSALCSMYFADVELLLMAVHGR